MSGGHRAVGPVLRLRPGRGTDSRPGLYTPPSIAYGELYRDVELAAIFPDSKTFPDMIPDAALATVLDEYRARSRWTTSLASLSRPICA